MKRVLNLTTNVFTIFAAWMIVTSVGPFIADQPEVGFVQLAAGLVFAAIAWFAWTLGSRYTPREARTSAVRFSRHRSEAGLLLLIPFGIGALLNFAGASWAWTIAGGLIAAVVAIFVFFELQIRLVPGDCITLDRGSGFQLAKVVNVVPDESGEPLFDLILFSQPTGHRPRVDPSVVPEDAGERFPTARMSMAALFEADFEVAAPAHLLVDAKLDGTAQIVESHDPKLWSPDPRRDG